jgi:hypothetical protein
VVQYTPDERYIIVRERLWRASNPLLSIEERQTLVDKLMAARRLKRNALKNKDRDSLEVIKRTIQELKESLGERGDVWWKDGEADQNRLLVKNSTYALWWSEFKSGLRG